jgi:arylsulfatase A-like enzyme
VPFSVVWPGVIEAELQSDAMISLVDVLPTLVEAAGGQPPQKIDGRSRLGLLQGRRDFYATEVFTTHSGDGHMNEYPIRSVRNRWWKYIRNLQPDLEHHTHIDQGTIVDGNAYWASWAAMAKTDDAARAVLKRYFRRPREELYDLLRDPHEQRNLAADPVLAEQRNRLSRSLDQWMHKQGDEGIPTENLAAEELQRFNATKRP